MENLIITNKGQELIAKLIAGTSTATFTKIKTSDHDYSGSLLKDLEELADIKQETLVSQVVRTDTTIVEVIGAIDNSKLNTGYYVRTVGLYARENEDEEILYAVSITEHPDYLPPFGGKTVSGITFKLNVKVDNSSQITLEVNPAAVATAEQLNQIRNIVTYHAEQKVASEEGVHGLRYFDDKLQIKGESGEWVDTETGGGGIAPNNVSGLKVKVGNGKLTVLWSDPQDTVVQGQTLCTWKGTKLVMKAGAYPENIKDGTVTVDNQVRNHYKDNGFVINNLNNGTVYYLQLFPYSDKNAVNENPVNRKSAVPQPFRVMTVKIDQSNSNPETSVTYHDDAVGMTPGSDDWDSFFNHKPCLLKNGVVQGYLNPNDFTKFENGQSADITSGNAGDVMIKFPRMGVKISTSGNVVTISMTNNPNDPNFKYYAHQRGNTDKDAFYLGAYKGYETGGKLRSLSGKSPTVSKTIGQFRSIAKANGSGYDQSAFYQLTFRQCMYLLKYKNLDSQTKVGKGNISGGNKQNTGSTNKHNMDYGTSNTQTQMCLFGIEDFWGNVWEWIDGLYSNSTRNIMTATQNFYDNGSGYKNNGQGASSDISGWRNTIQGSTDTGFIIKGTSGSSTTYYCDCGVLYASRLPVFGGMWGSGDDAGAFYLYVNYSASYSSGSVGGRLMYL